MALPRLVRTQAVPTVIALLLISGCGGSSGDAGQVQQGNPAVDGTPLAPPVTLSLSRTVAHPGGTTTVSAVLHATGEVVSGVQADIELPPGATIAALDTGRPECAVNPAIDKEATLFGFLPTACHISRCTGVRAVVLALENVAPIPDGAVVFTCLVHVDPYTGGTLELPLRNVLMSDPVGRRIEPASVAGVIDVVGTPLPRPTATPTVPGSAPRLEMAQLTAAPGGNVDVDVTLHTGGRTITRLQFSFTMPPLVQVEIRRDRQPRCVLAPEFVDASAAFLFQPPGCIAGESCDSLAGVASPRSAETLLPDGLRFTCTLQIAPEANGPYELGFTNVTFTAEDGLRFDGEAVNGRVEVSGPLATPTPTPDRSIGPSVVLSRIQAGAGSRVGIRATLLTHGSEVSGVQVDFGFPPQVRVVAKDNGRPDCRVNPDFGRDGSSFAYRPAGCVADDCTGIRALVLSFASIDPIPDGSELFTCIAQIAEDAEGTYALAVDGLLLSDPNGQPLSGTSVDGAVTVDSIN